MTSDQLKLAEEVWKKETDVPDWHFIDHRSRPLLMLHVLDVWDKDEEKENAKPAKLSSVVAWGIAFPRSGYESAEVTYVVNTTWWAENFGSSEEDGDGDED
jgi:hypothetical protein